MSDVITLTFKRSRITFEDYLTEVSSWVKGFDSEGNIWECLTVVGDAVVAISDAGYRMSYSSDALYRTPWLAEPNDIGVADTVCVIKSSTDGSKQLSSLSTSNLWKLHSGTGDGSSVLMDGFCHETSSGNLNALHARLLLGLPCSMIRVTVAFIEGVINKRELNDLGYHACTDRGYLYRITESGYLESLNMRTMSNDVRPQKYPLEGELDITCKVVRRSKFFKGAMSIPEVFWEHCPKWNDKAAATWAASVGIDFVNKIVRSKK